MKRVNQYERTDRDITNALLALMERKPLEKISVQEILEEAMINRSTFYQHFPDKYAVLEKLQERYLTEMTETIEGLARDQVWDLNVINEAMCGFMTKHRKHLRQMMSVRSENVDLKGQMSDLFMRYLHKESKLTKLEAKILADMIVQFMLDFIETEGDANELPERMLTVWMNMTLYFFRVDAIPGARERILRVIGEMHGLADEETPL
ncbi:MAG: TetR family transcriptional regulator [Lachnospiraceae bacterium]|nr:TetR family transcriptional regulator [Lachnospiraceae bacterium]